MTNLARKRKQLRLTQSAIADLLGIAQSVYSRRERSGIRTYTTAKRYARHLGCQPEEILN